MNRTALHRLRPPADEDGGFSLVEVLVAVVVLAVMSLAVFSGLVRAMGTSASSRARTVAAALAAQELERYDAVSSVPTITEGLVVRRPVVDGREYVVTTTATWQPAVVVPGADRCAGAGSGGFPYLKVSVDVKGPGRAPTVRSETLLTPKAGTGPADTAVQRVRVLNRAGGARANLQVELAGLTAGASAATSGLTDAFGCVVFTQLKDASYRASVSIAGNVGLAGTQVAFRDVTISSTATSRLVELQYDTAVQVDVALSTSNVSSSWPRQPNMPATLVNSGMQPGGQRIQSWSSVGSPVPPGTTTRAMGLFPFASGYQAWMGSCPDADPVRHGLIRPLVSPSPGTSASVSSTGGRVTVKVYRDQTDSWVGDATVVARDSCGGSYTIPGRTRSSEANGLDKGEIGVVLPLGTWTFAVTAVVGWSAVTMRGSSPAALTLAGSGSYDVLLRASSS